MHGNTRTATAIHCLMVIPLHANPYEYCVVGRNISPLIGEINQELYHSIKQTLEKITLRTLLDRLGELEPQKMADLPVTHMLKYEKEQY